jgi:hypothetical protein
VAPFIIVEQETTIELHTPRSRFVHSQPAADDTNIAENCYFRTMCTRAWMDCREMLSRFVDWWEGLPHDAGRDLATDNFYSWPNPSC